MNEKPVIVFGTSGHAKVVLDVLRRSHRTISGLLTKGAQQTAGSFSGVAILGADSVLETMSPEAVELALGIGSIGPNSQRVRVFEMWRARGFRFVTLIHPSAVISQDVRLGEGVQVMAGAVLQPGVVAGDNALINTRASVDHDCYLGDHVHVAPGATLSGGVKAGRGSHIGVGATVLQSVTIGSGCLLGAGAVLLRDLDSGLAAYGVPARAASRRQREAR